MISNLGSLITTDAPRAECRALSEAQRYPADFNAIIAGAPVYNQTHLHASQVNKLIEIAKDESRYVPPNRSNSLAKPSWSNAMRWTASGTV